MDQDFDTLLAKQILKAMPFGILITDQQGNITWSNDIIKGLIDVTSTISSTDMDMQQWRAAVAPFLSNKGTFPINDTADNTEIWIRHSEIPIQSTSSETILLHVFEDVSEARRFQDERNQLTNKLRTLTPVDPLTNLPSRHAMMQSLNPLVSLSRRYEKPLSLILLQIDNLDQFDEEQGEPTRGEILVSLSRLLKDQMRWADIIGRYDTDQFLLVLPETNREDAVKLVEKVHPLISHLDVPELPVGPIELTPKYGISQWAKGDDLRRLIKRTTQALHTAQSKSDLAVEAL